MTLKQLKKITESYENTPRMPVIFVGHGSPMNAIERNEYSLGWEALGKRLIRPNAVLCISAHWLTEGTFVHDAKKPKTIHDFWGFPEELYKISYPCPGAPEKAKELQSLIKGTKVMTDSEWGLDHGTWVVMTHLFPRADVPVFEMSIDVNMNSESHYQLGQELIALRDKGVLIVGSGNIVHNLGIMQYEASAKPFDWALEFDELTKKLIEKGDDRSLIEYQKLGKAAHLSVPTPDHYWPMLYALALRRKNDNISFPVNGISNGSISMRAILFGD